MIDFLRRRQLKRRAGSSAAREYQRLTKEWRRCNRKLFVGLTVAAVTVFLATWWPSRHHPLIYFSGAIAGGFAFAVAVLRQSPPPWIENWQVGAWGEARTAATLEPLLRRGWVILHDVHRRQASIHTNLDHVLIGPPGVFVLDTKNLHGTATVNGDRLALSRPGADRVEYESDSLARQARAQAAALNRLFRQRIGARPWVVAVVALWAEFPQHVAEGHNVIYVHGEQLVPWLDRQPGRLSATEVERLVSALQPRHTRPKTDAPAERADLPAQTASLHDHDG